MSFDQPLIFVIIQIQNSVNNEMEDHLLILYFRMEPILKYRIMFYIKRRLIGQVYIEKIG